MQTHTPSPGRSLRYELDILAGEVRVEGHVVRMSRLERELLIVLALRRRPVTRDELTELLYPHLDESTAGIQLKVYVHRVRRRLGNPSLIIFVNDTYRLSEQLVVDLWDIEAKVAEALRSRGALPPDLRDLLHNALERLSRRDTSWFRDREWCSVLDRRLQNLLTDTLTRLGEAALSDGDVAAATRLAADVFAVDPCDERGAELAIKVHLSAGDRIGAIRQYRRYERVLREEFQACPSSELTSLLGAPA